MNTKNNILFKKWQNLSKKERGIKKRYISQALNLSDNNFYSKLRENNFEPHERALISRYLQIPQSELFPGKPIIYECINLPELNDNE